MTNIRSSLCYPSENNTVVEILSAHAHLKKKFNIVTM